MGRRLMIVAHPDDEIIFGGQELLKGDWKVVCMTNARTVRCQEFVAVCGELGVDWCINDFTDRWDGFPEEELSKIEECVRANMEQGEYEMVVTHGKSGEYGHTQHKQIHQIVVKVARELNIPVFVFARGKKVDEDVTRRKIALLAKYRNESMALFDVLDDILFGTVKAFDNNPVFEQVDAQELSGIFDTLIEPLPKEEREQSGFGLCSKEDWIADKAPLADRGYVFKCTISEALCGLCYLKSTSIDERSYTTSILIAKESRGQGLGTKLKNKAIEYAFDVLDAKSVYDIIDVANISSIKASLNCGMIIVATGQLRKDTPNRVILRRDNPKWLTHGE